MEKFHFNGLSKAIFSIGMLISMLIFLQLRHLEEQALQSKFDSKALSYYLLISNAWKSAYDHVSHFSNAVENEFLIEKSGEFSEQEFQKISQIMPWQDQSITALAWAPLIHHSEVEDFEKKLHKSLQQVTQAHQKKHLEDVVKYQHDIHFPVYHSKIINSPDLTAGLDLASIPEFNKAFSKVILTDQPAIIQHAGENDKNSPIFSFIFPIFKAHAKNANPVAQNKAHLFFCY